MNLNHETARALVESKGTVTDAAKAVGVTRSQMSNILSGRRGAKAETIQGLAVYLGVNPYRLLGPEDPRAAVVELARLYAVTAKELVA